MRFEPTGFPPGSTGKIEVMCDRLSHHYPLFHPQDTRECEAIAQAYDLQGRSKTYTLVVPHIFLRVRKSADGEPIQDYYVSGVLLSGKRLVKTFQIDQLEEAKAFVDGQDLREWNPESDFQDLLQHTEDEMQSLLANGQYQLNEHRESLFE